MFISHSAYSFKFGVLKTRDVLCMAEKHGCTPLVLAEINSTAGILPALQDGRVPIQPAVDFRSSGLRIAVLLPESPLGFQRLNSWLSGARVSLTLKIPQIEDVRIIYPLSNAPTRKLFFNEWIGVEHHEQIRALRHQSHDRCLAWSTLAFRNTSDFNSHKLLRAIDKNGTLANLNTDEHLANNHYWEDAKFIKERFSKSLWRSSQIFLKSLPDWDSFIGKGSGGKNQETYTGSKRKDKALLNQLCIDALSHRYQYVNQNIINRLNKELEIIEEKSFSSYFLINWDIVRYAQKQSFFYVGRGSGANSIVAYLLKITNVDPIDLDLYFERFINIYRKSPPDFDLDFSWRDRQHITKYIFNRFPHTSLLGACNTFQYRSIVRELGKVFGLPKIEIDDLSDRKIKPGDKLIERILKYADRLKGLPNRMSIHSGGVLISQDSPHAFSSTFIPPKGFRTVDFDMHTAEDVGLHKFDILGQRGLSKISECIDIVKKNRPADAANFNIHDIQNIKCDNASISLLKNGSAMGCFYVESPAMRNLMIKLQTSNYLELVAASSVIRPGVSQSGMMREYIERHRCPEKRTKAHPILLKIMPETYGVMIYQEDVIKVAHYYGGLTLGESDVLRRGMSGKYRSREEFKTVQSKFFTNCKKKGYPNSESREIWRQIESFAGYAFAKGHSASYAIESFQSLYLKARFPIEYMVATINNGGGFYKVEFYLQEARRYGAKIESPCVNDGECTTILCSQSRVIIGMNQISGIDIKICQAIELNRKKYGRYKSLVEFIDRLNQQGISPTLESLLLLIKSEAFRFTYKSKRSLFWEAHYLLGHKEKKESTLSLFELSKKKLKLPELISSEIEDAYDQLELFGFSLCHPFRLFREWQGQESVSIKDWNKYLNNYVQVIGYVVTIKNNITKHGCQMQFGTFQEYNGDLFDTVHFPIKSSENVIRRKGIYILKGIVKSDLGCFNLEVISAKSCPRVSDPRYD